MKTKLIIALLLLNGLCYAQMAANFQSNLSKRVTIDVKAHKISEVLKKISNAGRFYFAYNGALFQQDSIVNLNVKNTPVRDVLDQLFEGKVDYRENAEYIILRYAVNHFTIEAESIVTAENLYAITGHVIDIQTGKKVKNASVYEKRLLQSSITDEEGFFSLKFKGEHKAIILTASKETYRDTALVFLSSINVKPEGYSDPDKEKGTFFDNVLDNLRIGRWFASSKQRIQNMNVPSFLANTPFQASLTPGLSSHGGMSTSVVNKFSLNILGGYTAGVDGFEMAGVFNLNKGDVGVVQVAGGFNVVGGNVRGFQISGVYNEVRKNVVGVQVSTLNKVNGTAEGFQISAVANLVDKDFKGVQVTGLLNVGKEDIDGVQVAAFGNVGAKMMNGLQIAGIGNSVQGTLRGVQISGIFNYVKKNTGFQIGLINVADTSTGVSLGLLNIVRTGYHKISLSGNELINANLALKTGNANLYTIFLLGKNFVDHERIETFGLGFGHDFFAGKRLSIGVEATAQQLYLGNWDYANILTKFQTNLQIRIFKGLSIYGGPTLNYYISDAPEGSSAKGYKQQIASSRSKTIEGHKAWFGWNAGITIF